MQLPTLTDEDRKAHPHNSDVGIQAIILLNALSNEEIQRLLTLRKDSDIYMELVVVFSGVADAEWVTKPIFILNIAKDIAVRRKMMKEDEANHYWK